MSLNLNLDLIFEKFRQFDTCQVAFCFKKPSLRLHDRVVLICTNYRNFHLTKPSKLHICVQYRVRRPYQWL